MSETQTPRLGLPYLAAAQAQKHVVLNESLIRLDAVTQACLISVTTPTPPSAPMEGDLYAVPAAADGAWAGREASLARWQDGAWLYLAPPEGMTAFIADEGRLAIWRAGAWLSALAISRHGAATAEAILEQDVDLLGASVDADLPIPDRAVVLAVTTRTLVPITGAMAFDCGIASEPAKFGGSLGTAAGASNLGVIGPTAFYAPTPVRFTAIGSPFSAGRVRLAIHCWCPVAPAA